MSTRLSVRVLDSLDLPAFCACCMEPLHPGNCAGNDEFHRVPLHPGEELPLSLLHCPACVLDEAHRGRGCLTTLGVFAVVWLAVLTAAVIHPPRGYLEPCVQAGLSLLAMLSPFALWLKWEGNKSRSCRGITYGFAVHSGKSSAHGYVHPGIYPFDSTGGNLYLEFLDSDYARRFVELNKSSIVSQREE